MKARLGLFFLLFVLLCSWKASATHIVGGEVTYKFLGIQSGTGKYLYQIRLDLYQDCITGDPNAIAQDSPAYLAIFNGNGYREILDSLNLAFPNLRVPTNF